MLQTVWAQVNCARSWYPCCRPLDKLYVFTLPRPPSAPCLLKFQLLLSPAVRASHLPITTRGSGDPKRLCCEFRDRDGSLSKFAAERIIRSRPVGSEPHPLHCTARMQVAQSPSHCTVLYYTAWRSLWAPPTCTAMYVRTAIELGKPTSLLEGFS